MPNIKIDNIEVSEESLRKVIKEHPELLDIKKGRPLGDNFSMLGYLNQLRVVTFAFNTTTEERLNALIKIWTWKEENDGQFGDKDVFDEDIQKFGIYYDCWSKNPGIMDSYSMIENTELPHFSSQEIAEKALKELEAEYKIVFNVA